MLTEVLAGPATAWLAVSSSAAAGMEEDAVPVLVAVGNPLLDLVLQARETLS